MTDKEKLIDFWSNGGCPYFLNDIIFDWSYDDWEMTHNFIQWIFPTSTPSSCNSDSPILTTEIARYIRTNHFTKLITALVAFENFLLRNGKIHFDHNALRISRVIQCLKELGLHTVATDFFAFCIHNCSLNNELDESREIWLDKLYNTKPII